MSNCWLSWALVIWLESLRCWTGVRRSATVSALKEAQLAFVDKAAFERFADEKPAVYRHMLSIVGKRLRHANDVLAASFISTLAGPSGADIVAAGGNFRQTAR